MLALQSFDRPQEPEENASRATVYDSAKISQILRIIIAKVAAATGHNLGDLTEGVVDRLVRVDGEIGGPTCQVCVRSGMKRSEGETYLKRFWSDATDGVPWNDVYSRLGFFSSVLHKRATERICDDGGRLVLEVKDRKFLDDLRKSMLTFLDSEEQRNP